MPAKRSAASRSVAAAMLRVDALRNFAPVVRQLGGDPSALLSSEGLSEAILSNRHAIIPYIAHVNLLKRAAADRSCADFGMRLAMAQEVSAVLGPLEVAMRNSATVLEALALKKPVLLSDCIGNRDIVHGGLNGDLFQGEEEAILKILRYYNNRDMLGIMGEYSRELCAQQFDVHTTFNSYRQLYKS